MKHKHHIVPKHMGGSDDSSNLIELTAEEHAQAHLDLYEKHGKKEDLCAYYMLSGNIEKYRKVYAKLGGTACQKKRQEQGFVGAELFYGRKVSDKERLKYSSNGGKIQGPINSQTGHIQNIQKIGASLGGKKSSEICREKQVNAFFDPNLRNEIAKLGGKAQGKVNAENGHLQRIAKLPNKRSKGKLWITNGIENKMIESWENIDNGWRKGKTQKAKV